jgi:hypothetical protein
MRRTFGTVSVVGLLAVVPLYSAPPLSQLAGTAGCVSDTGTQGACAIGRELSYPGAVAVSPDGHSVYVGSFAGLAIFDRDPSTGELQQKEGQDGCIHGISPDCGDGRELFFVASLALSPDGSSLYAASLAGLAVFDRDPVTGTVEQKAGTEGCFIEEVNNEARTGGACTSRRATAERWRSSTENRQPDR